MPRLSPVTTILLRECAGTGLAVAAFAYSGWITVVLNLSLVTTITHPDDPGIELHAFFGTLACLLWWTGIAGLRLAGWRTNWPTRIGLLLTGIHTIELTVAAVVAPHLG
ncbi:hypothetical protein SAMN04487904_10410 [Actinopolyspora lacussalsi subsp. righensis]|uniref:Uncharacterized protein n=1 Tax=Actinopolyspora righensis TaxID=995060 RepID=A0A1I6Z691_9ACTN|nr:hypothetical protein [Actinopolyspora righensis]SFT58222.1 hypothetical protein SAMN04487904_10410 [Actinopolyspora righensis]